MRAFIVSRDRLGYLEKSLHALLRVGLDVTVVDHGSMWPDMLNWLDHLEHVSGPDGWRSDVHVWRDENRHPRDVWRADGPIAAVVGPHEPFVVTDSDVVPDWDIPSDWVGWMKVTLDRYPALRKVGLGLRTDDLPEHYAHRDMVREWEAQYQAVADGGRLIPNAEDGRGVFADIDTTLAMYRWYEPFTLGPAMRLRAPYVARHLSWYEDSANLTPEQVYYRDHAEHGHWRSPAGYADEHGIGGS